MPVKIHISKEKFLPIYRDLILSDEVFDIDFLYGGRDGGRTRQIVQMGILACLADNRFRGLLIRKVFNTIGESMVGMFRIVVEDWGISHLFNFTKSPLEIHCVNGGAFYARGLDEAQKIKSFANPSWCWVEEGNEITAEDFVIILTSLRSDTGKVKTFFSFNPECEMTYTDFWLWQEYFMHTQDLSFKWIRTIETPRGPVEIKVRATHATYLDNPYCSDERMALYESYKTSKNNAYHYQTYTLGLWGYRRPGGEFWKCFEEDRHTSEFECLNSTYHIVADNNVNPYVAIAIWQIDVSNKQLLQVDELPCEHPYNTASKAAGRVVQWLNRKNYDDNVYIYGDPSANAKSTTDDEGRSFFDKFIGAIRASGLKTVNRVGASAPSVSQSGAFINEIFEVNYGGWAILINKKCRKSIEDYNMAVEDIDGKILKKKVTNKETGVSYEKYGHYSDDMRYFITTILPNLYTQFLTRRHGIPQAGGSSSVRRTSKITP